MCAFVVLSQYCTGAYNSRSGTARQTLTAMLVSRSADNYNPPYHSNATIANNMPTKKKIIIYLSITCRISLPNQSKIAINMVEKTILWLRQMHLISTREKYSNFITPFDGIAVVYSEVSLKSSRLLYKHVIEINVLHRVSLDVKLP